jgi:hypothetical protein
VRTITPLQRGRSEALRASQRSKQPSRSGRLTARRYVGHCLKAEALPFPIPLCVLCEPYWVSAQGYHSGDWGDLLLNDAKENDLS